MSKLIGSICLIAGTAIGAGMLALPIALAKLGILLTVLLMVGMWLVMYYTSLATVELNLRAGRGMPLSSLGELFSGPIAKYIGGLSLKLLSYALFSAYLYACASATHSLAGCFFSSVWELKTLVCFYAVVYFLLFCLAVKWIDYCNRILFCILICGLIVSIGLFLKHISISQLPIVEKQWDCLQCYQEIIPIVFTSFGFQIICHSITSYCHNEPTILKRAFFWGSLIPVIIYSLWTAGTLCIIRMHDPVFYNQLVGGHVEVGEFIKAISQITHCDYIPNLLSIVSILAILTSAIGVGIGLIDSWKEIMRTELKKESHFTLPIIFTLVPAFFVAYYIPDAFMKALCMAGMISTIIAIFLPLYLLKRSQAKHTHYHYPILNKTMLKWIVLAVGVIIVICECFNLI